MSSRFYGVVACEQRGEKVLEVYSRKEQVAIKWAQAYTSKTCVVTKVCRKPSGWQPSDLSWINLDK